jgi:Cytochrome P450
MFEIFIISPYPSDRERIADISIFMIAGHDTTAYQLSWIIIELSRNPDVVIKLRAELDELFPTRQYSNVTFTPQQLSNLTYLASVIKEGKEREERENKSERERRDEMKMDRRVRKIERR